jgi:hypothetical protein
MTNIIAFPGAAMSFAVDQPCPASASPRSYEFTPDELDKLGRWYSAMRYAFPTLEGAMTVSHKKRMSAVGLYGPGGTSCLIAKHEEDGRPVLLWSTDQDRPRRVDCLEEITDRQIGAIAPPSNEKRWLDLVGWMTVVANRVVGEHLYAV